MDMVQLYKYFKRQIGKYCTRDVPKKVEKKKETSIGKPNFSKYKHKIMP